MATPTVKQRLKARIERMPDDVSMDEAMAELMYFQRIERAQQNSSEDSISQEELEEKYQKKWAARKQQI
jgi:hypothetical protein